MKEEPPYETVRQAFSDFLAEKKYRKTPERFAILEKVYSYDGFFDAEMIFEGLQHEYRVSRATVYNTLEILSEAKLIVSHLFDNTKVNYEKCFVKKSHHFLICSGCGKMKEFSDKQISAAIQVKNFKGFEISYYTLTLYGLCNKCKRMKK